MNKTVIEFKHLPTTNEYRNIVLSGRQIIDVRAPIEFNKGSLPNAINIPLLNNEQREIIGTIYKKQGHEAAFAKGVDLLTPEIQAELLRHLAQALNRDPSSIIMCFRGGDRSKIVQQLIYDHLGHIIPRIIGGFKQMRQFLMTELSTDQLDFDFYLLAGHTGSGKTITIAKCKEAIDLEAIANHRGSTFGSFPTPQPTQINFEHQLAYQIIKLKDKGQKKVILEKEGKLIGRNRLPEDFYQKMMHSPLIVLESTLEERVEITYQDYVISDLSLYNQLYGDQGKEIWQKKVRTNIENLNKRFGGDRTNRILQQFLTACETDQVLHKEWIRELLNDYYDPMYDYQRKNWQSPIIFSGKQEQVLQFLDEL